MDFFGFSKISFSARNRPKSIIFNKKAPLDENLSSGEKSIPDQSL